MNRRELLTRAAGALVFSQAPNAERRVPSPAEPQAADRLYDPSVVQERAAASPRDNDPAVKELEHRLKCSCGCNLDIYTCRTTDFTCTYSPTLHREVLSLLDGGKTADQVIDAFVAKYGESILMAPKPQGFNLAGYLVPGILVALAALVLAWVLIRRSRRLAPLAVPLAEAGAVSGSTDIARDQRLRQALEDVED